MKHCNLTKKVLVALIVAAFAVSVQPAGADEAVKRKGGRISIAEKKAAAEARKKMKAALEAGKGEKEAPATGSGK